MTLALKVATRNKVNSKANYVRKYLQDYLQQYINKKIVKLTPYASFTAKIQKELFDFEEQIRGQGFRLVFMFGQGRISAQIDTTYRINDYSVNYVKQEFYICSIENCVLTDIENCLSFRTDYTEQEIVDKRQRIAELDRKISAIKGEMNRFEQGY